MNLVHTSCFVLVLLTAGACGKSSPTSTLNGVLYKGSRGFLASFDPKVNAEKFFDVSQLEEEVPEPRYSTMGKFHIPKYAKWEDILEDLQEEVETELSGYEMGTNSGFAQAFEYGLVRMEKRQDLQENDYVVFVTEVRFSRNYFSLTTIDQCGLRMKVRIYRNRDYTVVGDFATTVTLHKEAWACKSLPEDRSAYPSAGLALDRVGLKVPSK